MNKTAAQILLGQHVIAFNPLLADIAGDVKGGLFLSQLCYWSERTNNAAGWFYKTAAQWFDETRLTRYELKTAADNLKALNVIEIEVRGVPAKSHYRVNWPVLERLIIEKNINKNASLLETSKQECGKPANKNAGKQKTRVLETSKQECGKPANKNAGKQQSITETTTETKPENSTEKKPSRLGEIKSGIEEQASTMTKQEAAAILSKVVQRAKRLSEGA